MIDAITVSRKHDRLSSFEVGSIKSQESFISVQVSDNNSINEKLAKIVPNKETFAFEQLVLPF